MGGGFLKLGDAFRLLSRLSVRDMPLPKRIAIFCAVLVLVGAFVFTAVQPAPSSYAPDPPPFSLARLVTPIEENAWNRRPTTTNDLYCITFWDAQSGLAVGDGGTILRTTDGGRRWTPQASGTTNALWSVTFLDAQTGWAVGTGGTILRTKDGGQRWTKQASGTTNPLSSVTFRDAQSGWAVGESGTILRTKDGGQRWTKQASGTTNDLGSVFFVDAQTGWAVGDSGTILRTTDGGGALDRGDERNGELA
jgi:photosystem II stability/assembly factor-like uncharacterized protein